MNWTRQLRQAGLAACVGLSVINGGLALAQPEAQAGVATLPAIAFSTDTALALHADLRAMTGDDLTAALTGLAERLEPTHGLDEATRTVEEVVETYTRFRADLLDAGGIGLALVADVTEDEAGGAIRPVLLIQSRPDAEPDGLLDALGPLLDTVASDTDAATVQRLTEGWRVVAGVGRLGRVHPEANTAVRDGLADVLDTDRDAALRLALRITPSMRQTLRAALGLDDNGRPGSEFLADPLVAVVRHAARSVEPIEAVTLAARVNASPRVTARLWFPDESDARAFATAYTGFLNLVRQFMGPVDTDTDAATDDPRRAVEQLLAAIRMTQTGRQLRAELDRDDLSTAIKLGPSLGMMLLMGPREP